MRYSIGLDIGIASVGFAIMKLNEDDLPCEIFRIGSRVFDVAENPKDGAPLAKPRRESRGMRRRLRRKSHRKERIRSLIVAHNILSKDALEELFSPAKKSVAGMDIYQLRTESLDRLVTAEELARILIHLAQRRGFQSNRKGEKTSKEDGLLLKAIDANAAIMTEKGYRTVGEMLYKDASYEKTKRNKGEDYKNTVTREMIKTEAKAIFAAQRALGNVFCTEAFESAYLDILLRQRSFDEGPGKNSPYAGDQITKMLGDCTFEPDEKRAPKASYSFELFELLTKINHFRIDVDGKTLPLTGEQREILREFAHKTKDVNYAKIRKELNLPEHARFRNVRTYDKHAGDVEKAEKEEKFKHMQAYHDMRLAFDKLKLGKINISHAERNEIGRIFSLFKNGEKIETALIEAGFDKVYRDTLIAHLPNYSKFGNLSIKALDKIIPHLEQGLNYDEACTKAGYDFKGGDTGEPQQYIDLQNLQDAARNKITSAVSKRAISQCAKVLNAIIREMDGVSPVFINIELAREMAKNFQDRKEDERGMKDNAAENERAKERISQEFGKTNPTGLDIVKLKLYKQQSEMCPYSLEQLDIRRLFEPGYVDIDHIVPYSISFDDTYKNKVLVKARENRQKGNFLPLEYLKGEQTDRFIVWVNNSNLPAAKKRLLLKAEITQEDRDGFKERNLQDTKAISSFLYNYLTNNLQFSPFEAGRKRHVTAVNGRVTSMLRSRWGLSKVRADGDTHHALDAAVIACTTQGDVNQASMIAKIEQYYQNRETLYLNVDKKTGEVRERFPLPYDRFDAELLRHLNQEVFVSRMPSRKVSGAAHKETIKGVGETGTAVKKVALTALKLDKENEITDYHNPNGDPVLYEALKRQLIAHGGNGEKAFAEPFYRPQADTQGPLVKKVKLEEKSTLNVPVHKGRGIADNDSMVRVDVFHIEGEGYYLVPIYVADTVKGVLPNKAIVAHKPYEEWKEVDDEHFIFSLYPNDLIYIKAKKSMVFSKAQKESKLPDKLEQEAAFVYYKGTGISVAAMTVINHDNSYKIANLGAKTLQVFEKYQVDVLGNKSKVGFEPRQDFHKKGG